MKEHKNKPENCLNCGYHFADANNFCPKCGQENHSLSVPLKHILLEIFEGTIHFDTKIFKTFFSLLFRPGFLTSEFNSGRRVAYVPPVRIYIFVSFLFFLLLNIFSGHSENGAVKVREDESKKGTSLDIQLSGLKSSDLEGLNERQIDSTLAKQGIKTSDTDYKVMQQVKRIEKEGSKDFLHTLFRNISYLMFFIMPVFALIVYLFHLKRKQFYYEFLIYSIHLHSFLFLLFSIYILVAQVVSGGITFLVVLLLSLIYLYMSLIKVFPQQRLQAAMKIFSILFIHGFLTISLLVITVVLSVISF